MPDLLAPALSGLFVRLVARSRSAHSNKVARPNERLDERLSSDLLGLGVATRLKLAGVGVADERQDGVLGVSDAVKEAKKVKIYGQGVSTTSSTHRVVPHERSKERAERNAPAGEDLIPSRRLDLPLRPASAEQAVLGHEELLDGAEARCEANLLGCGRFWDQRVVRQL